MVIFKSKKLKLQGVSKIRNFMKQKGLTNKKYYVTILYCTIGWKVFAFLAFCGKKMFK